MDSPQQPDGQPQRSGPGGTGRRTYPFAAGGGTPSGGAAAGRNPWAGREFGPYVVQRFLAKGGMGVVLLGYDPALRRFAALKVMDAELATDEDAARRFEREARACAAIDHPNVARIYLVSISEEGTPFLAMEYLEGGSFLGLLRRTEPVPYSYVLGLMEQVAAGLEAGRKRNIIHRDVKPANLMLARDGTAKVVDFGLAKMLFDDSFRTREGMVLGTPTYMAPEQCQGRSLDHRADIYSFGATLFHLLTLRPPFKADSPVQTMMKHNTAPVPFMRSIDPGVPFELDDIVQTCMRKDPADRYQDYRELISALGAARLQCRSRERGAIVGDEGQAGTASQMPETVVLGASMAPSTAVAGASGGSMRPAPAVPAEQGGWGFAPSALLAAGGAVLAMVAVVVFVFGGGTGGQNVPVYTGQAGQEVDDYAAYRETVEALETLRRGVLNYRAANNVYPGDLGALVRGNWTLVNFEITEEDWPLDGWGGPFAYSRAEEAALGMEVRSAGRDERFFTSADLVVYTDGGEITVPFIYRRMEERRD